MGIQIINPTVTLPANLILNLKTSIINDIANIMELYPNIIIEEIYNLVIEKIYNKVINYLKIYQFYPNIKTINIEIYNKNITSVLYFNFLIGSSNVTFDYSRWISFYSGIINSKLVYNNMGLNNQNNLAYAIIKGDYYIQNNIIFGSNNQFDGIILKKSCLCNCECPSDIFVIALYWNI